MLLCSSPIWGTGGVPGEADGAVGAGGGAGVVGPGCGSAGGGDAGAGVLEFDSPFLRRTGGPESSSRLGFSSLITGFFLGAEPAACHVPSPNQLFWL